MAYQWPLQRDIVTAEDKMAMIQFLSDPDVRLTAGPKVKDFERKWSLWLNPPGDLPRSLFVHSGSAANLLLFAALIETGYLRAGDRVAMPTISWGTTLSPLTLFGLEAEWINVHPDTLTMDLDELEAKNYDFIWVTHLAGMANPMQEIMQIARKKGVQVAEDCCQAYGAYVHGERVGTFGLASTASFYFGHHMTTIEGGMLTINDPSSARDLKMASEAMRAHGLSREISDPAARFDLSQEFCEIDDRFLFSHMPFNFRNTELNAVLGLEQLARLDEIVVARARNFHHFTNMLRMWKKFSNRLTIPRELPHCRNSSFCLPFVFNTVMERERFTAACETGFKIETRPLAGGPLMLQPAFQELFLGVGSEKAYDLYSRTVYIGNNHLIEDKDWSLIHQAWKDAFDE
jgi:CDP-6-deoxy-D-xylo-4-hexulose-3-dehydrase